MRSRICPLMLAATLWAGPVLAQALAIIDDATLPRFEVASVKPADPNAQGGRFGFPPGRFVQQNVALFPGAVSLAFGLEGPHQIAQPLPDLLTRERFTINAVMPAGAPAADRSRMLRALLIDRFKLRYHVERSEADGFTLTLARRDRALGPNLRPNAVDCSQRLATRLQGQTLPPQPAGTADCAPPQIGPGSITLGGMSLQLLVGILSRQIGAPVVDQTGLTGTFDVELRYSLPARGPVAPDVPPSIVDDTPSIFTAVQEQLGLRLSRTRVPVDRLVIDHIERPEPD